MKVLQEFFSKNFRIYTRLPSGAGVFIVHPDTVFAGTAGRLAVIRAARLCLLAFIAIYFLCL
jgi:hypothetical protein